MLMNLSSSSPPFSLVITLLFLSTFLTFSQGVPVSQSPTPLLPLTSGKVNGSEAKGVVEFSWGITRRSVVEVPVGEPVPPVEITTFPSSSLVLAAERTYRKDPLNGFKRYTGGWSITERHYWASVAFTAVPLFAIAAIWFVGFGICLLLIFLCYFCCKRQPYGYSRIAYAISLIFLVLFTVAAMLGCIVLYVGQGRFHNSTTKTLEYVVHQADMTVRKLKDVSDSLATAKQVGVDKVFLPSNVQTDIDEVRTKINSSASDLADKTVDNSDNIRDLLDSVRVALIVIAAIMLLLIFLGFLFSIFGMQLLVYILVILGWMLVTGTFILCGTFLVLHNVAADTCVAMHDWIQNPTAHTALDDILPCVDNATAQETLLKNREVTSQLVEVINQVITNVSNINFSPNFPPMYFNQSGPLVPVLCNPFFPDLTDRICTAGEVNADNATEVWRNYVCQVSATGICTTTGRLTPAFYDQMTAAVNVGSALYNYASFLVQLQDCTYARETFTGIYVEHCPGLRRYSRWIYIGLVMVSTAVMLSLIFWVIYGRERPDKFEEMTLQETHNKELNAFEVHRTSNDCHQGRNKFKTKSGGYKAKESSLHAKSGNDGSYSKVKGRGPVRYKPLSRSISVNQPMKSMLLEKIQGTSSKTNSANNQQQYKMPLGKTTNADSGRALSTKGKQLAKRFGVTGDIDSSTIFSRKSKQDPQISSFADPAGVSFHGLNADHDSLPFDQLLLAPSMSSYQKALYPASSFHHDNFGTQRRMVLPGSRNAVFPASLLPNQIIHVPQANEILQGNIALDIPYATKGISPVAENCFPKLSFQYSIPVSKYMPSSQSRDQRIGLSLSIPFIYQATSFLNQLNRVSSQAKPVVQQMPVNSMIQPRQEVLS